MKPASPLDAIALPPILRRFVQLLASLTLLCGLSELFCTSVLHLHARYGFVLLDEWYPDFRFFADRFASLHTLEFFTRTPEHPFMYPAPVALPYALFFRGVPHHAQSLFLLTILLSFLAAAALLARALRARGLNTASAAAFTASTLLLSFPIWFLYRQANMEFAIWLILSIGLWSLFHQRPYTAAICIGIAGSMKLFPFVYLGLLLSRRQFRAIAVGIVAAVALTLVSLWIVYPDIPVSWHLTEAGIENFRQVFMLHLRPERGFDHSLFGLFKNLAPHLPAPPALARILSAYLLIAATAGIALYALRIRKLPVINQLLALTIASILLPPTSFDYTLIHLYAPWTLLVLYTLERYNYKTDRYKTERYKTNATKRTATGRTASAPPRVPSISPSSASPSSSPPSPKSSSTAKPSPAPSARSSSSSSSSSPSFAHSRTQLWTTP